MKQKSQVFANLTGLVFLSIVFGIVYMIGHTREIIGILTSYIQLEQRSYINISNIAYCLVGLVHILLPFAIIYPHKSVFQKRTMLKSVCYAMAIIYVVANLWVIEWLLQGIFSMSISFDVAQYLKVENMMFNHMQWVSRNAETIFYNHMASVVWFLIGYNFDRDRRLTWKLFAAQMLLCYLLPVLAYFLYRGYAIPDWWMKKTIPLICCDGLLLIALIYLSTNREAWARYVSPILVGARSRRRSRRHRHHHHHHHHGYGHSHHSHHSHHVEGAQKAQEVPDTGAEDKQVVDQVEDKVASEAIQAEPITQSTQQEDEGSKE